MGGEDAAVGSLASLGNAVASDGADGTFPAMQGAAGSLFRFLHDPAAAKLNASRSALRERRQTVANTRLASQRQAQPGRRNARSASMLARPRAGAGDGLWDTDGAAESRFAVRARDSVSSATALRAQDNPRPARQQPGRKGHRSSVSSTLTTDAWKSHIKPDALPPASRDVSYLADSATPTEVAVPPTTIPLQHHIKETSMEAGKAADEDWEFDAGKRRWTRTMFPSRRPAGRQDVVHLSAWLAARQQELKDETPEPLTPEFMERKKQVYSSCLHEITRQVMLHCADRGKLLVQVAGYVCFVEVCPWPCPYV